MGVVNSVKISFLDAIEFLVDTWMNVTLEMIANCFRKTQLTMLIYPAMIRRRFATLTVDYVI